MTLGFHSLRRGILLAGLCLCAPLLACQSAQASSWWNGDWNYRIKMDADAGPKGANIGDSIGRTQILVRLLANNFKFDSAKPDGSDIRFVSGDDRTPLHYHIEKWDGLVDQVALIWVDVTDLAPGAQSSIYMYWGNAKANDGADAHATYDGDQLLVWHFGEDAGLARDSTGFGNASLTPFKRDDAAIIGAGAKLDGTAPIKLPPSPSLNLTAGQALTWQLWVKPAAANQSSVIYDQRDAGGVADFTVGLQAGAPYVAITSATGTARTQASAPLVADSWHLVTVTESATLSDIYVDGTKVAEAAGGLPAINGPGLLGGAIATSASPVTPDASATPAPPPAVPATPVAVGPANFTGEVDEFEISKTVRPAGAIAVAAHTQGPQANLLTFENPEQTSSFGSGYFGIILRSVTPDAFVVIAILMVMFMISTGVMISKAINLTATTGANKKFRVVLRDTMRAQRGAILPSLSKDTARNLRVSCLFRVYETGARELNERLAGGRTLPDGSIAPQSLDAIRSAMDATMVAESQRLSSQMVLLTIAIAGGPFIGLLGTVVGVMITFAAIAAAGDVNVNAIAPGISAALLATVAGLAVAIPALFGYNYFQVQIKSITAEMNVFVDNIVTRIAEGSLGGAQEAAGE